MTCSVKSEAELPEQVGYHDLKSIGEGKWGGREGGEAEIIVVNFL